jgi:hypothetical protein
MHVGQLVDELAYLPTVMGFTGTRYGMTDLQKEALVQVVEKCTEFHHGLCVGSDAEAHAIVRESTSAKIHGHPTHMKDLQADLECDVLHSPKPPLDRDKVIVMRCKLLVATPLTRKEERHSGTWYTVRQARRWGKPVILIYPDGVMVRER